MIILNSIKISSKKKDYIGRTSEQTERVQVKGQVSSAFYTGEKEQAKGRKLVADSFFKRISFKKKQQCKSAVILYSLSMVDAVMKNKTFFETLCNEVCLRPHCL